MGSIINENIRYYKANDPYYFEVDNLPLRDLVENDKNLEEAVLAISGETSFRGIKELARKIKNRIVKFRKPKGTAAQAIGREGFDDLLPYVSGEDGRIYVTPGIFSARTSRITSYHDGSYEQEEANMGVTVGDPLSENRLKNQEFNTPGRIEIFQLLADSSGVDPSISVPSFDVDDFQFEKGGDPAYRIDLIGVAGGDIPYVFLIEGAGFGAHQTGNRMDILDVNQGGSLTDAWENDPESLLHDAEASSTNHGKLDFGTGTKKRGNFPLPDDLFNSAPQIINNSITGHSNAGFGVALAYILVPAGFVQDTAILDANIMDVRPFFRSAELTLAERQGVSMADPPASNSNPFTTQAVTKALEEQITNVQTLMDSSIDTLSSNIATDFSLFGKVDITYAKGSGTRTLGKSLSTGSYMVITTLKADSNNSWFNWGWGYGWNWGSGNLWNLIECSVINDTTNAKLSSAFGGTDNTQEAVSYGGNAIILSARVEADNTICAVQTTETGVLLHAYWIKIS